MPSPHILTPLDTAYPTNLKFLSDPPAILYILGRITPQDSLAVAVVGSRQMSSYGQKITRQIVTDLVKNKVTIISGLARGIDTIAHQIALEQGGRTIAVLGSGLDIIYPPENTSLFRAITQKGAVVSQFPLGTQPLGPNFLARNRLISALSRAVLVIEGNRKSGTLSTATYAAHQGKEVFGVPGPITSPSSEAPHFLIKEGAHLATCAADILDIII